MPAKEEGMTISVRMTPVKALADDKFKSLFDLYAAESGIESFGNWAVAWQNYEAMENAGCLVVYVAYDDDTPVGIIGCLVTLHLHYCVPMLSTDGFFVLPEYRDKGVGGHFFRVPAMARAKDPGNNGIYVPHVPGHNIVNGFHNSSPRSGCRKR